MAEVLSIQQLKALSDHKYSSEGISVLEPLLQKFWRWLVELVPLWVAPNLITIFGLIINVATSLLLMYYSPDAKTQAPSWVYLSCGVGLFVYQALDAIDGKQARRTGSSSPLGELFDHGCDAVSNVFVSIAASCALGLGSVPPLFYLLTFDAFFTFYCAHWQTYVCGTLKFGKVDVTEGQLIIVFIFMLTSVVGIGFWGIKLPLLGISLNYLPAVGAAVCAGYAWVNYFSVIFGGGQGKNGATVADTSVLFPALPIGFLQLSSLVLCGYVMAERGSRLFFVNPCLYTLAFGIFCAKVTCRLVVAHMTKSELAFLDPVYFGPLLLLANQYFDFIFNEYLLLWVSLIYGAMDLGKYSYKVCSEIATHLHICVFKIPYAKPDGRFVKKSEPVPSSSAASTRGIRSLSPHTFARRSIHETAGSSVSSATPVRS